MSDLERLIAGMHRDSAYPHAAEPVEHIETHISHVFLAGDYAYKLKKPLNLGFLDFSTLERRHFCCEEELRLNGRLAPHIYLGVVQITGSPDRPRVGGEGPVLEYAVKMARFDQAALLTRLPVTLELADRIAARVAEFHASIPSAAPGTPFGSPRGVLRPMRENFEQIRSRFRQEQDRAGLESLERWTLETLYGLRRVLNRRKREGHVRECHGDMHRGNIALVDGELVIFDGIEFNPSLRWIDTMSELAFLVMDLEAAGEIAQARRLLNRYLELSGDYEGLRVLDFYKVYRAMVRAKVTAIRLGQADLDPREAARDQAELEGYVSLAAGYTRDSPIRLVITHGVSGSGKSWIAARLRERLPLVHIRSDLERKRLFGLPAGARSGSGLDAGIYTSEAGRRTYDRLLALARVILEAGYSPLVDATFLKASHRRSFLELAAGRDVPCVILDLTASPEVLRERVVARASDGLDPSEAELDVLAAQLVSRDALAEDERRHAMRVDTARPADLEALAERIASVCSPDRPR
jgi:aminoglycoside phosphotransferase family enzyme/predicted kinase